jgi:hypothetical protein
MMICFFHKKKIINSSPPPFRVAPIFYLHLNTYNANCQRLRYKCVCLETPKSGRSGGQLAVLKADIC